jgi:uncharacterized protein YndB with AHSA1/START domain
MGIFRMTPWNGAVEQRVTVSASAGQVWALVSVPGWFISSRPEAPALERIDEWLTLVHDDRCGLRVLRTLELTKPSYVAFRWEVPGQSSPVPTMIEFWVTEQGADAVQLKVRESGIAAEFDHGSKDLGILEENAEGWTAALEAVRIFFE